MPTCITYLNFNIVDLLVWAVLRLAEPQNKETAAKSTRHLQQRSKGHDGNKGNMKSHFSNCEGIPTDNDMSILGKPTLGEYRK